MMDELPYDEAQRDGIAVQGSEDKYSERGFFGKPLSPRCRATQVSCSHKERIRNMTLTERKLQKVYDL